jgi:hypothetical protein
VTKTGPYALSMWRPWGLLTVTDRITIPKNPENRLKLHVGWRGDVYLHSGRRWDPEGAEAAEVCGLSVSETDVPTGYIGIAKLVDVHKHDGREPCGCNRFWAEPGVWHWVWEDVRPFKTPLDLPGRQGLFRPDPEVVARTPKLLAG